MIRLPKRVALVAGAVALVLLVMFAVPLITNHQPLTTRGGSAQAVYYCPMHPTYTADRPGDCPICNMKLVKKELEPANPQTRQRANTVQDICYMHNCPMMKPGQQCPMMIVAKAGETVTCPVCGTHVAEAASAPEAGRKKILYWTDPMIPGFKADGPGKSPMGMDLVPVYAEETPSASAAAPEGYAPILVTPQKRQFIGVTTARAERRVITKTIRTVGQIANDPELYQAQQEYLQSLKGLEQVKAGAMPEVVEQAQRMADASRLRLRRLGLSHELIDDMATWTGPDQSLLLADPSGRVWLYAPIYEYELPLVKIGQTITIEIQAIPGKTLEGTIRAIDSGLDPATRAARVRAEIGRAHV